MSANGYDQWPLVVGIATSVVSHAVLLLWLLAWRGVPLSQNTSPALIVSFVDVPDIPIDFAITPIETRERPRRILQKSAKTHSNALVVADGRRLSSPPIEQKFTPEPKEPPLGDWRQSVRNSVRLSQSQGEVDTVERAVKEQSSNASERALGKARAVTSPVAQAFDSTLGKGWRSGTVSSETRPDGSRVERIWTSQGAYCVRIPSQAAGIDPFVKQERPLIAVKC